jgi:hypothetical protein
MHLSPRRSSDSYGVRLLATNKLGETLVLAAERVLVAGLAGLGNRLAAEEALGRCGVTGGPQPDRGR